MRPVRFAQLVFLDFSEVVDVLAVEKRLRAKLWGGLVSGDEADNRHRQPERNFEVIARKGLDRDCHATRFASVRNGGSGPVSAIELALQHCGANKATSLTALTDGDAGLRAIQKRLKPLADQYWMGSTFR